MIIKNILILILIVSSLYSKEKVSIYLKWEHSFQFAGYYAALEKGFYEEEGLDVSLFEGGPSKRSIDHILSTTGNYGISDASLLYEYLNGKPVVLVSQIFQHSPIVLLSHKDSNIDDLSDIKKDTKVEFANQIIINKFLEKKEFNKSFQSNKTIDKFINREVDVIVGYSISTPFYLKDKGVEVNIIDPKDYGIDFYGDNLFTSLQEANANPQRVEKIRRATIKGWQYALINKDEIIDLISSKYKSQLSIEALNFEASEIKKVILPELINIGTINKYKYDNLIDNNLQNKRLNSIENFYFNNKLKEKQMISLSKDEKEWLSRHNKINFTGDPSWLPIEAFDENKNYVGIVSDYLREIEKLSSLNFNIVYVDNWSESIAFSKNRVVDVLSDTTESYRKDVIFTKPYFKTEIVIVMNKKHPFVNSLDDISNRRIGIVKDYSYITKITSAYPDLKYVKVEDVEAGLNAVSRGEIDAFLVTLAKASYSISAMSLSNIKIVGKTEFVTELGFAVRKDYPELVSILNKSIDNIEKEKKNEIFNKWVKANYIQEIDYSLIIKIVIVFLLILSWFIYTNYRMKKEINLRKELEKSLKKSKNEAILANKSKSEFLANMSHEIRTPMNSIIGFSELLEQTQLDNRQKGYLKSIIKGSKSLLDIINDILDLSKIEAGKLNIKNHFFNVKNTVDEIYQIFTVTAEDKKLLFEINIKEDMPTNIFSDEVRFRQILINLVGNAIKFTEKGFVRIYIDYEILDDELCNVSVCIHDSGLGIKENELENIFKNFHQQDGQNTRKFGGTGLGLAISKRLASKLNGKIKVESEYQKGSKFTLHLSNIKYNYIEENVKKDKNKIYIFEDALVLIVDDIKDNRELLKETLALYKIKTLEAKNGKEAVDIVFNNDNIDLVLMDIRMPVMDGYEALENIKKSDKHKQLPIVAVTASILKEEQKKIFDKGFSGFLQKPVISSSFMEILCKYLKFKEKNSKTISVISDDYFINEEIKEEFFNTFNDRLNNKNIVSNFTLLIVLEKDIRSFAIKNEQKDLIKICNKLKDSIDTFDIEQIQFFIKKLKAL